jgi:hypothetical protein
LRGLFKHLSMENYLCSRDYLCSQVAYEIVFFGGIITNNNFKMWYFWPNRFLAFQDHKLKQKGVQFCWGIENFVLMPITSGKI